MGFDIVEIAKRIFQALKGQLSEQFIVVEDYAEYESKKIADTIGMIQKLVLKAKISEEEAKLLLQMQINSTKTILLSVEGLDLITVQRAINTAMSSIRDDVNYSIGFNLLG